MKDNDTQVRGSRRRWLHKAKHAGEEKSWASPEVHTSKRGGVMSPHVASQV